MSPGLPEFVPPMLAKIGDAFSSDDYLFEIKWDGTRALAFVEGGDYRLLNRKQRSRKDAYPELAFLADLPDGTVVDGEIVIMVDGRPEFSGMLRREQAREPRRIRRMMKELPAAYVVFDLLYDGGESVMDLPLTERRERMLDRLGGIDDPRLILSDGITGDGLTFFEEACKRELEGVVAKRLASRYLPGKRSDSWLKIKRRQRTFCAILGFLPDGDHVKSLLIGVEDGGRLSYAGRVGSGWDDATRARINKLLRARVADAPIVPCPGEAVWVEPGLYCTVDFLERGESGELRAPVFVEMVEG